MHNVECFPLKSRTLLKMGMTLMACLCLYAGEREKKNAVKMERTKNQNQTNRNFSGFVTWMKLRNRRQRNLHSNHKYNVQKSLINASFNTQSK